MDRSARRRRSPPRSPAGLDRPSGRDRATCSTRRRASWSTTARSCSAARRCGCSASPTAARRRSTAIVGGDPVAPSALDRAPARRRRDPSDRRRATSRTRFAPGDVTVVVPTLTPSPIGSHAILRHAPTPPASSCVDDALRARRWARCPERRCCGCATTRGPAAARNAGLDAVRHPAGRVRRHRRRAARRLARRAARSLRRRAVGARRTAGRQRRRRARRRTSVARYEERHSPLDLGREPARIAAAHPGRATCRRRRSVARVARIDAVGGFDAGVALRRGRRPRVAARRRRAGGFATSHRCRCSTRRGVRGGRSPTSAPSTASRRRALARASRRRRRPRAHESVDARRVGARRRRSRRSPRSASPGPPPAPWCTSCRGVPPAESLRLVATGHAYAGLTLADAVRRCWLPLALVAARRSRRVRMVTLAALVPALLDGGRRTPARRRVVRRRACGGACCDGARSVRCCPSWCRGPDGGRSRLHRRTPVRPVRSARDVAAPRRLAPVATPRSSDVATAYVATRPGREGQRLRVRPRCPRRAGRGAARPLPPGGRRLPMLAVGHGARARPGIPPAWRPLVLTPSAPDGGSAGSFRRSAERLDAMSPRARSSPSARPTTSTCSTAGAVRCW